MVERQQSTHSPRIVTLGLDPLMLHFSSWSLFFDHKRALSMWSISNLRVHIHCSNLIQQLANPESRWREPRIRFFEGVVESTETDVQRSENKMWLIQLGESLRFSGSTAPSLLYQHHVCSFLAIHQASSARKIQRLISMSQLWMVW